MDQKPYLMITPQMAGVSHKELGFEVTDLFHRRDGIIAAIDFLFTGI